MPARLPEPVQNLIEAFGRLPGIGPKMAARLTFTLLQKQDQTVTRFVHALQGIQSGLQSCQTCGHITEQTLCSVCRDTQRSDHQIALVENSLDVIALDKTGSYTGLFHVLGGVLSPIDGIGPDQLRIALLEKRLQERVNANQQTELIIATNPSLEGEATAAYLVRRFAPLLETGLITVTRIARGLPMGSDIEYADPTTLARALEGRSHITQ
jgi:recombination protein RecR